MNIARRLVAISVFACTFIVHAITAFPSVTWWESAYYTTAAATPGGLARLGAPLAGLLTQLLAAIPMPPDTAVRMNYAGVFFSACSAAVASLLVSRVVLHSYRRLDALRSGMRLEEAQKDRLVRSFTTIGGGAIAGLTLAFSDTFWTVSAAFSPASWQTLLFLLLLFGFSTLLSPSESAPRPALLIAAMFCCGILAGGSWLFLVVTIPAGVALFWKWYDVTVAQLAIAALVLCVAAALAVLVLDNALPFVASAIAPGAGFPRALVLTLTVPSLLLLAGAMLARRMRPGAGAAIALACAGVFVAGYSTIGLAARGPARVDPMLAVHAGTAREWSAWQAARADMRGGFRTGFEGAATMPSQAREAAPESFADRMRNNDFLRYFFWNFVGKSGDIPGAPAAFLEPPSHGPAHGAWSWNAPAFPNLLFAIPLLVGLAGIVRAFRYTFGFGTFLVLTLVAVSLGPLLMTHPVHAPDGGVRDHDAVVLLACAVFSLFIGFGAAFLGEMFMLARGRHAWSFLAIALVMYAVPGRMLAENFDDHDHSRDYAAIDYACNMLRSCPKDAVLFTQGENDGVPLLYARDRLNIRTDVALVNTMMLGDASYRAALAADRRRGDTLLTPADADSIRVWDAGMRSGERTRLILAMRAPRRLVQDAMTRAFETGNSGRRPDSTAAVPDPTATLSVFRTFLPAMKAGDRDEQIRNLSVFAIASRTLWKRPVCFSVACDPGVYATVRSAVRLDGLVWTVVPVRFAEDANLYYHGVSADIRSARAPSASDPAPDFILRPGAFEPRNSTPEGLRLADNYRNLIMRVARYEYVVLHDVVAMKSTLDILEHLFLAGGFPMTHARLRDLGALYAQAGYPIDAARVYTRAIEEAWASIRQNPSALDHAGNPYQTLMRIYGERKDYDAMLAVLDTMAVHNRDRDIIERKQREVRALRDSSKFIHQP